MPSTPAAVILAAAGRSGRASAGAAASAAAAARAGREPRGGMGSSYLPAAVAVNHPPLADAQRAHGRRAVYHADRQLRAVEPGFQTRGVAGDLQPGDPARAGSLPGVR